MALSSRGTRHPLPLPLLTPDDGRRVVSLATDRGGEAATVLGCLDARRRPLTLFVLQGRGTADELSRAVAILLDAHAAAGPRSPLAALLLGSGRPGRTVAPEPADQRTWAALVATGRRHRVRVLDWFVVADGRTCSVAERDGPAAGW